MSQPRLFLRLLAPSALVLLAAAAVVAISFAPPFRNNETPEFRRPGAVTAEQLPDLGANRVRAPNPDLAPDDVVRIQLAGLADQRSDGVGILQCYCFASPSNRAYTGPLERFGRMVRQEPFACLARPHVTLVGRAKVDGPVARVLVTVMERDRSIQGFVFILSRQPGPPFARCWLTEAVYPVGGMPAEPTGDPAQRPPRAA